MDLFGPNTFAHAYWPTSYLDFSINAASFSLIGPNETRGGFRFHSPIVASSWVTLVQNDLGERAILTGEVPTGGGGGPNPVPESGSLALLGLGLLGVLRRRFLVFR